MSVPKKYDFSALEKKYSKEWKESRVYEPDFKKAKKPFYNLMMFPYPSAEGLHVGNMYAFTGSDVYGRLKRMQGFDVFEPIGLDGFGIHSENYALKIGAHPMDQAEKSEKNFYRQLEMVGNGFAWEERLETYSPEYYRWTQWLFRELWKAGLAYRKRKLVNWCPSCKTVLADEQVIGGKCERCGTQAEKKDLEQWFFRITKYAEKLLKNLDKMDWSDRVKIAQRNWIGRSEGAKISFGTSGISPGVEKIEVFTTRPDTIFGATYLAVSPELANEWIVSGWNAPKEAEKYVKEALLRRGKTEYGESEKTGVFSGIHAENPATKGEIPVWIADYVLPGYGTGAIMAVPAHDARDFEFAKKFDLPVRPVLESKARKHLIFDFDGVIADTYAAASEALIRTGEVKNKEEAESFWKQYFHNKPNNVRGHTLTEEEMKDLDRLSREFGAHMVDIGYEFFDEFVKRIKDLPDTKIAIVSRGEGAYIKDRVKAEGIPATHVLTWEDHHSKEEKIEQVCRDWGVGIDEVYYFTDSKADVYELENHIDREKIIGCGWGYCGYDALREILPENQILRNPEDFDSFFDSPFEGDGALVHSGKFSGKDSALMRKKMAEFAGGKWETEYRLRDWLISRQRYWGAPIPMVFCESCAAKGRGEQKEMPGWYAVPEEELPVLLPRVENFRPTGTGVSPLASVPEFHEAKCPSCGGAARRETDVCDTFLDSSWYYLGYFLAGKQWKEKLDGKEMKNIFSSWCPVGMYIGGAEHAVLHLLYVRFIAMVLADLGYISFEEPAKKFRAHGLLIKDGAKMSKSKGNVINPDEYIKNFGADAFRMYLMFLAPFEEGGDFRDEGILGPSRFLDRVWKLSGKIGKEEISENLERAIHRTIKKVGEDIEALRYNTAISALMVLLNEFEKEEKISSRQFSDFLKLMAPFAPFISEELWRSLGNTESIHRSAWPKYDEKKTIEDTFTLIVQVNGKVRAEFEVPRGISEAEAKSLALADKRIKKFLGDGKPKKTIFVKDRLLNFVV